jgi:hypothetical protein
MHKSLRLTTALLFTGILISFLVSCQSSRMSEGFTYSGSKHAPDMSSSGQSTRPTEVPNTRSIDPVSPDLKNADGLDRAVAMTQAENQDQARVIAQAIKEEMAATAQSGRTVTHREMLHTVTEKLVKTGQIAPIPAENMRKMDKMARKMDQKAQKGGPDLDMRNISGIEWFFLIMSGAGLTLGIIGIALGWVVFLVFGGLFLYWKLVQDKK